MAEGGGKLTIQWNQGENPIHVAERFLMEHRESCFVGTRCVVGSSVFASVGSSRGRWGTTIVYGGGSTTPTHLHEPDHHRHHHQCWHACTHVNTTPPRKQGPLAQPHPTTTHACPAVHGMCLLQSRPHLRCARLLHVAWCVISQALATTTCKISSISSTRPRAQVVAVRPSSQAEVCALT